MKIIQSYQLCFIVDNSKRLAQKHFLYKPIHSAHLISEESIKKQDKTKYCYKKPQNK